MDKRKEEGGSAGPRGPSVSLYLHKDKKKHDSIHSNRVWTRSLGRGGCLPHEATILTHFDLSKLLPPFIE